MAENTSSKGEAPDGERIAKVLSRRGVASRREAERLIEAGEVSVNGKVITSPALNVTDADKITVSGQPLPQLEPARLWLYYKPDGLVTSASDEKGRDTVFDHLPQDMPRVMSVGRLDLNSEGLLLLTNDGELKRRLELPSTGWLRKYRVRVNGNPTDPDLEPLRKGIVVEGEKFQPMNVVLDRHQGANAWLTVGLREGKNREIRRAMAAINLTVNRLIRISYGPFRLGELKPGEVEEVRAKVLREQLGEGGGKDAPDSAARKARPATRRLRPGEAVKALAKAWEEATAQSEQASKGGTGRKFSTSRAEAGDGRTKAQSAGPGRGPRAAEGASAPRKPASSPRPFSLREDAPRGAKPRPAAEGPGRPPRGSATKPGFASGQRETGQKDMGGSPVPRGRAETQNEAPRPRKAAEGATPRPRGTAPKAEASGPRSPRPAPSAPRTGGRTGAPPSGKPPSRPRKG